jgi:hypothetical protein
MMAMGTTIQMRLQNANANQKYITWWKSKVRSQSMGTEGKPSRISGRTWRGKRADGGRRQRGRGQEGGGGEGPRGTGQGRGGGAVRCRQGGPTSTRAPRTKAKVPMICRPLVMLSSTKR